MRTPFCSILNEMLLLKIRQIPICAVVTLTIAAGSLFAQEAKAPAPPKNLKLIPANVDLSDDRSLSEAAPAEKGFAVSEMVGPGRFGSSRKKEAAARRFGK